MSAPRRTFRLSARSSVDRDVDDEIRFHLDSRIAELVAAGLDAEQARRIAAQEFGDAEGARRELAAMDRHRAARTARHEWFDGLAHDARFALRTLRRSPGFTAAVLVTLTLALGATALIASVVDGIVLRALPYPHHDRLAIVWTTAVLDGQPNDRLPFSAANFLDLRAGARSFAMLAAVRSSGYTITGNGEPQLVSGARVTPGLFEALGVHPYLGRTFTPDDDHETSAPVAVLGYDVWRTRFGGDRGIVGRPISLDGISYTVVGVMPPGFAFPRGAELPAAFGFGSRAELWTPATFTAAELKRRGTFNLVVVGLLAPGVSLAAASTDAAAIVRRITHDAGFPGSRWGAAAVSMQQESTRTARPGLLMLLGAVVVVLLIACANVSNLVLARTAGRRQELAVRAALGASRGRLGMQLVTEGALLALAGAAAAGTAAALGLHAVLRALPPSLPRVADITVEPRVLIALVVVALLAGAMFGALALGQVSSAHSVLRTGARAAGGRGRLRQALVIAEVGLSLVLLIVSALLVESFVRIQDVRPGFNPAGALTATVILPSDPRIDFRANQPTWADLSSAYLDRLNDVPGIEAAGAVSSLPLTGAWESTTFSIVGRSSPEGAARPHAQYAIASPNYFRAMGVTVRGRAFTDHDDRHSAPVAIVSKTAAERYWPGTDPVGQEIQVFDTSAIRIVGVAGDVRQASLTDPIEPMFYLPVAQFAYGTFSVVVRGRGSLAALAAATRRELRAVAPGAPLTDVKSLEDVFNASLDQRRFAMLLVSVFAASAAALATIGLYSVMAYTVRQRTREIGIRLALGARPADVRRMMIRQGVAMAVAGIGLGIVAALALSGVFRHQLYEVSAADPATYLGLAIVVIVIALAASWAPARRATRVDPSRSLQDT
jgi:putative ABC transport system permease protein